MSAGDAPEATGSTESVERGDHERRPVSITTRRLVGERPPYLDSDQASPATRSTRSTRIINGFRGMASIEALRRQLGTLPSALGDGARFHIGELIGHGGQGLIFAVEDSDCRRTVALKVLRRRDASQRQLARFIHEAQITAQLGHPGIVPVHDLTVLQDGTICYSMKRIEGENLLDFMRDKAGHPEHRFELLQILLKASDAIAFAHSHGVIHRDIKPMNIMVGGYGEVLVVDWGLSKVQGGTEVATVRQELTSEESDSAPVHLTRDGATLGTIGYMSPEQARGENALVDARSDVYSLGVVLYEILVGSSPYPECESHAAFLELVGKGSWLPLQRRSGGGQLAPQLMAIAQRAMAVDRRRRYADVTGFTEDLRRYLAGQSVSAYHESGLESCLRWMRHNGVAVRLAVVVAVLALLVGLGWWGWATAERNGRTLELAGEAEHAIAGGDADAAVRYYDRLLELAPDDGAAAVRRLELIQLRDEQQRERQQVTQRTMALEMIEQARGGLDSDDEQQLTAAIELITRALGLIPSEDDHGRVLALRDELRRRLDQVEGSRFIGEGMELAADGKWSEAGSRLQLAVRCGYTGDRLDTLRDAIAAARIAEETANREAAARESWDLAIAAAASGDHVTAMVHMEASLRLANLPGATAALLAFGQRQRDVEAAAALDRRATAALAAIDACIAAAATGDTDRAWEELVRAADLDPSHPRLGEAREALAEARRRLALTGARRHLAAAATVVEVARSSGQHEAVLRGELEELLLRASYTADQDQRRAIQDRRDQLRSMIDEVGRRRAEALETAQQELGSAARLAGDHPEVLEAQAAFYRDRVLEAEAAGLQALVGVYAALGREADQAGQWREVFDGQAIVQATGSDRLTLHAIERPDLPAVVLDPGVEHRVPAGRYRVVGADGVVTARRLARGRSHALVLPPPPAELPAILAFVPPGAVLDSEGGVEAVVDRGFAMLRREISCGDWLAFLNDVGVQRRLRQAAGAQPNHLFPRRDWTRPESLWQRHRLGAFSLESVEGVERQVEAAAPVTCISRLDVLDYIAWRREADGLAWRLPSDSEWRLAAQSGDGRRWTWGDYFDPGLCCSATTSTDAQQEIQTTVPGGSFPQDQSVHGIYDLAGSVAEMVDLQLPLARIWLVRGGSWRDFRPERFATSSGNGLDERLTSPAVGFRLVVDVVDGRLARP